MNLHSIPFVQKSDWLLDCLDKVALDKAWQFPNVCPCMCVCVWVVYVGMCVSDGLRQSADDLGDIQNFPKITVVGNE